ncbi:hypothetical protein HYH02_004525 [Chlamydomonas schloesseri]|uniref:Auxin efflux carrier component n=1 Tax=Chlamydomonas schloesseri TaxID=2026947 RepID=A0A835WNG1_9CHLO|nr:hypothetical protein HYH02_004525 [Chlamydomonas schloesseri]|eukprot:KAG2450686.1 hypothetical protein HYH02_004525 [Chlamydomonas schloesseri]
MWQFQGVLNAGVQILLVVFCGWCFSRFRLLEPDKFMGQINVLLLRVGFTSLNIYLLGIKLNLKDAEAWRSLGAYVLWVTIVQAGILVYTWVFNGRNTGDAGLLNLVLTANNTVIVGLPVMNATFPEVGGPVALLTAFVLFLQVIPFSITAFEVEKWLAAEHARQRQAAELAAMAQPPGTPQRQLSGRLDEEPAPYRHFGTDGSMAVGTPADSRDASRRNNSMRSRGGAGTGGGKAALPVGLLLDGKSASMERNGSGAEVALPTPNGDGAGVPWGLAKGGSGFGRSTRLGGGLGGGGASSHFRPAWQGRSPISSLNGSVSSGPPNAMGLGPAKGAVLAEQPTLAAGVPGATSVAVLASLSAQNQGQSPRAPAATAAGTASGPAAVAPAAALVAAADDMDAPPGPSAPAPAPLARVGSDVPETPRDWLGGGNAGPGPGPGPGPVGEAMESPRGAHSAALSASSGGSAASARSQTLLAHMAYPDMHEGSHEGRDDSPSRRGSAAGGDEVALPLAPVASLAQIAGASSQTVGVPSNHSQAQCAGRGSASTSGTAPAVSAFAAVAGAPLPSPAGHAGSAASPADRAPLPSFRFPAPPAIDFGAAQPRAGSGAVGGARSPADATMATAHSTDVSATPASRCTGGAAVQSAVERMPAAPSPWSLAAGAATRAGGGHVAPASASAALAHCTAISTTDGSFASNTGASSAAGAADDIQRRSVPVQWPQTELPPPHPHSLLGPSPHSPQQQSQPRPASQLSHSALASGRTASGAKSIDISTAGSGALGAAGRRWLSGMLRSAALQPSGEGGAPPSPPLHSSSRLLNPLAVACPDLPVPQALTLAKAPESGAQHVAAYTQLSNTGACSGGGGALPIYHPHGAAPSPAASVRPSLERRSPSTRPPPRLATSSKPFPASGDTTTSAAAAGAATAAAAVAASAGTGLIDHGAYPAAPAPYELHPRFGPDAVAAAVEPVPYAPPPDRALVRAAAASMARRHGGLGPALGKWFSQWWASHKRVWAITWIVLKNPLLWSLLVALVINLSGLRDFLYPASPSYLPELGWVAGALAWTSGITVPVSLFSNGVWLYGKSFSRQTWMRAIGMLALKLLVLGPLQLACAAVCGMTAPAAMSLLMLALCPVASTSFVISAQYGHGADVVTAVTMLGIVLLVPAVLVGLTLPRAWGLYDFTLSSGAGL